MSLQKDFESHNFRIEMQRELLRRKEKNPSYSLRAFAQSLGVYHATLSAILAGRRPLTAKSMRQLGNKLGLSPKRISELVAETKMVKSNRKPDAASRDYELIEEDIYSTISQWYYDAILELARLPTFNPEPKVLAKTLGISVHEARAAFETLVRVKMIVPIDGGRYELRAVNSTNILHPDYTSVANKKYQQQILEKSLDALEKIPVSERSHTSTTMAVELADLPKIKELVDRFRHDLDAFAQRDGVNPDSVYQLSVSVFPLINKMKKEKGNKR